MKTLRISKWIPSHVVKQSKASVLHLGASEAATKLFLAWLDENELTGMFKITVEFIPDESK